MLQVSEEDFRNRIPLYPLTFEPIYQYRLWGGRRLADLLAASLPDGPVGEAWARLAEQILPGQKPAHADPSFEGGRRWPAPAPA